MINQIFKSKTIILIIVLIICILAIIILQFLILGPKQPLVPLERIQIVEVIPSSNQLLEPSRKQNFTIKLSPISSVEQIEVKVLRKKIQTEDEFGNLTFKKTVNDGGVINILLDEPIASLSEYQIDLLDNSTKKIIRTLRYSSDNEQFQDGNPNNPALKKYLPYETNSFRLTYSNEKDIYIFSFKADPNSTQSIDVQYDRAKAEAIKFIEDKGVSLDSISIEWRFS